MSPSRAKISLSQSLESGPIAISDIQDDFKQLNSRTRANPLLTNNAINKRSLKEDVLSHMKEADEQSLGK